jgi:hypothetical protein
MNTCVKIKDQQNFQIIIPTHHSMNKKGKPASAYRVSVLNGDVE